MIGSLTSVQENMYIKFAQKDLMGEVFIRFFSGDRNGIVFEDGYVRFSSYGFFLFESLFDLTTIDG
jgi:hypothetical protein